MTFSTQNPKHQIPISFFFSFLTFYSPLNMVKPSFSSLFSLLLILLITVLLLQTIRCDESLIEETCKKTPYFDLCVASLQSNSESADADVEGLACIMAKALLSNASDTLDYIRGLIKQAKEEQLQKSLANCAELYIPEVKYNLPQAIDAVTQGHFSFANYIITDASKQADACQKGLSGSTESSSLTDRNKLIRNLCDVAAAILKILLHG